MVKYKKIDETAQIGQDELKNSNIVAAYSYEHNDGDQIWEDETKYYKLSDGTFRKKYCEGYYGETYISVVEYNEVADTMSRIEREVQCQKEAIEKYGYDSVYARGGYTIDIPLLKDADFDEEKTQKKWRCKYAICTPPNR